MQKQIITLFIIAIIFAGCHHTKPPTQITKTDKYDSPPVQLYDERPVFPRQAMESGLEGWVIIQAFVSKEGKILKALAAKSSHYVFEQPAIQAAKKGTYTPATEDNKPVGVWISYRVNFELEPTLTPTFPENQRLMP